MHPKNAYADGKGAGFKAPKGKTLCIQATEDYPIPMKKGGSHKSGKGKMKY